MKPTGLPPRIVLRHRVARTHHRDITMKTIAATLALTVSQVAFSMAAAPAAIPYPSVLDAAAVGQAHVADLNREALAIGNGDLNALVWERNGTLCLRVAKNDVWDARIDTSADPPLLKVDIANQKWSGGGGNVPSWGKPYPSPRAAAVINIGITGNAARQRIRGGGKVNAWTQQPDIMTKDGKRAENRIRGIELTGGPAPLVLTPVLPPSRTMGARLDLRRAVASVGATTVRALADRNVFLIESDQEVSLEEIKSAHLPAAELGDDAGVKWLHQKMPGDQDYPGMEYALAVAANGPHKAVALVTSRDTRDNVRTAAVRLARETAAADSARLIAAHEAEWNQYWSASGVSLGDPDFEQWWYRMVYMLRCHSKPGVVPAGLWAFQPNDSPNWHGDYHHNYNAWQPFWTPFIINHPAQAEPWVDYMNEMLPRLKWYAKTTYGCEGAFVGISSFAFEPDPAKCRSKNQRQIGMMPWGYTMGMIGMSAQVLWHHHLYQPDRRYLGEKIYPVIREAALFFCSFAEKCPRDAAGKVKFGPSYSPEHGGFGGANVPFDLAYARFSLDAGIAAAGELGRDADLVARFRKALASLPDYPTAPDANGKPVVVDWTGCKFREIGEHNIVVPAIPVFPGEQVTWFSPEPDKELFRNTLSQTRHRGCNSTILLSVGKARLSMPEAVGELRDYYKPLVQPNGLFYLPLHGFYLSECVGVAAGISEFLLQSVGNTIRVFPCWPQDKDAGFTRLRAQGGFLVTAEQKGGKVVKLEITSTVGGKLRVLSPWTGRIVERDTDAGETVILTPSL